MRRTLTTMITFAATSLYALAPLTYSTPKNTTEWLEEARFGILFDWSARVNFETDIIDSYDHMEAKGLQKGSLYGAIKDENGNPTDMRQWEAWSPQKFHPAAWLDAVEDAGANYFVFTTNDRYGFLNFDSPATSIDIAATKWGVDTAAALANEAQKRHLPYFWRFQQYGGIDFILGPWVYFKSRWSQGVNTYAQYRKKSLFHLIENSNIYGRCAGIYFSGNAGGIVPSEHPAREGEDPELYDQSHSTYLKTLLDAQPWLTISSEFYLKRDPNYHPSISLDRFKFRNYNTRPDKEDGSHSITFSLESDLDGWAGVSKEETRTPQEVIHLLALAAGHNENLLLQVTPDNQGAIPQRQHDVLQQVGAWMQKYKESILGTVNGPYWPGAWGVSTRHANSIYLHILQHSSDGRLQLEALPSGIRSVTLLNNGLSLHFSNSNGLFSVELPQEIAQNRQEADLVVRIDYPEGTDTTTFASLNQNRWKEPISTGTAIHASQTSNLRNRDTDVSILIEPLLDSAGKGAKKLYPRTYWSAPQQNETQTLHFPVTVEVDLGNEMSVGSVSILEKNSRIKKWHVDYLDTHGTWQTLYQTDDEPLAFFDWRLSEHVTTQKVRLVVEETYNNKAPQLRYFRVFG